MVEVLGAWVAGQGSVEPQGLGKPKAHFSCTMFAICYILSEIGADVSD